jgi:uncharacterized membrane protein YraQ (UPF0718 family)
MLPYVIIGILVGELLKYIKIHRFVTGIEDKPYLVVVLISSVLGILSPLCTYGTVPIVMRMNKAGIKVPVLIAFLISLMLLKQRSMSGFLSYSKTPTSIRWISSYNLQVE